MPEVSMTRHCSRAQEAASARTVPANLDRSFLRVSNARVACDSAGGKAGWRRHAGLGLRQLSSGRYRICTSPRLPNAIGCIPNIGCIRTLERRRRLRQP